MKPKQEYSPGWSTPPRGAWSSWSGRWRHHQYHCNCSPQPPWWRLRPGDIIQLEISIQVTWLALSNQRSVFRSRDLYWPIRGQYSGHVTSIVQSETSIYLESLHGLLQPRLKLLNLLGQVPHLSIQTITNLQYQPIRGQYSGHVISIDQSQASIQVTWLLVTNHRPVFTLL